MKTIKRFVPELAFKKIQQSYENNPPLFIHEKEVFYFILDLFYRLKIYNRNVLFTEEGLIRISSKYFRAYIPKNYASYLTWLINEKIIICDKIKETGKSYGYEIHPDVDSKLTPVEINFSAKITKKIIENYNKRNKFHKKTDPHILIMRKYFKNELKFNTEEALAWMESDLEKKNINLEQYNVYWLSIKMIEDKDFYFKINTTNGRLDTNLTNLKSELRQFIIGEYCHIDTVNSQPLLVNFIIDYIIYNSNYKLENRIPFSPPPTPIYPSLGTEYEKILSKELSGKDLQWLKKFPLNENILKEFNEYRNATFNVDFYSHLKKEYEELHGKVFSRKELKDMIYKVFFSQNFAYRKEKAIFRTKYPTLTKIIYKLKKQRHNKFALCLQKIESEIFINRICKRLVEEGIVPLTIHDSVIVLTKDKSKTIKIISEVYLEILQGIPELQCSTFK